MKISSIPNVYRNVNRWREILSILSKYGLADWISRFDVALVKGFLKNRDGQALAHLSRETRIRLAIEELGPTFIKLGQILSTRPDQVGMPLAQELQKLQTSVACDQPDVVRETIEAELGKPLDALFVDFDSTPLASASIGQAHRARLSGGDDVVVKVQHVGIRRRMEIDLDILAGLAQLAEKLPELESYRPQATVAEFRRTVRREFDFAREARNLQQFARNFARSQHVRIPRFYPHLSTGRVLTISLGLLIGGPLAFWLLTLRDLDLFVPVFAAAFFFLSWFNGPIAAVIFDVVPSTISATVAGAYLLFIHLVGDAVAFPLIGALSDRLGLDRAVLLLPTVAVLGGLVILGATRTVARDMARVR